MFSWKFFGNTRRTNIFRGVAAVIIVVSASIGLVVQSHGFITTFFPNFFKSEEEIRAEYEASLTPDDWYEPEVIVPDFQNGADPDVVYNQNNKRNFRATWVATVRRVRDNRFLCSGTGTNSYRKGVLENLMRLSIFVNPEFPCDYLTGEIYYIEVVWPMMDENGFEKTQYLKTPNFRVLPEQTNKDD